MLADWFADWFAQQGHAKADTDADAHALMELLWLFIKLLNILVSPFVWFDVRTLLLKSTNVKPPNAFLSICTYLPMADTCFYGYFTIMGFFIRILAWKAVYRPLIQWYTANIYTYLLHDKSINFQSPYIIIVGSCIKSPALSTCTKDGPFPLSRFVKLPGWKILMNKYWHFSFASV